MSTDRPRSHHRADRWEVGGEFHLIEPPVEAGPPFPSPHRLSGLATHALTAAWDALEPRASRRLHVPDFFCQEVATAWERSGIPVVRFADDPRWPGPDWTSLDPDPGDVVLAVDFFGIRDGTAWTEWRRTNADTILIEDHSHDPGSAWALSSEADYAFASLRKSMPISDGAILWSPRGHALPPSPEVGPAAGSAIKLAAMVLKREYLSGGDVDHGTFRTLQLRGERELLEDQPSSIAPWNTRFVDAGLPGRWRDQRERNVRQALSLLGTTPTIQPLFETWPDGHCPFNLVLVFPDQSRRDACQATLIAHQVFAPIHWIQPASAASRARDLSSRILTIPLDQRYGSTDVTRVVDVLLAFEAGRPGVAAPA